MSRSAIFGDLSEKSGRCGHKPSTGRTSPQGASPEGCVFDHRKRPWSRKRRGMEVKRRSTARSAARRVGEANQCGGMPWRDTAVECRTVLFGLTTLFSRPTAVSPMQGFPCISATALHDAGARLGERFPGFGCAGNPEQASSTAPRRCWWLLGSDDTLALLPLRVGRLTQGIARSSLIPGLKS